MERIYRVIVADEVAIDYLQSDAAEFTEAEHAVIHRESTAIERFYDNANEGSFRGCFYFSTLDNARSYALLNLQAAQERLAANMDRILDYRGLE